MLFWSPIRRVASPLILQSRGLRHDLSPEDDPNQAFDPVHRLAGQSVTAVAKDDSGALTISFTDGTTLTVPPDDAYEAWNVSGPNGALVVSMPSGELAIWTAEAGPDVTQ